MNTALVCGSHLRGSQDHVWLRLDNMRRALGFERIVCGGADYVDTFAITWAMDRRVHFAVQYADWDRFHNWAGPRRNKEMLDLYNPMCIIAFDGDSGTLDMMARGRARGIEVHVIV